MRLNHQATLVMTQEPISIGGFVPRFIAGQEELSNHAFGLALDIDPAWNPIVKGERAIAAFRQATGVTFGDWLYAASSVDALAQTYKRVAVASEKLKAWLRRMLPAYDDEQVLRADLARAKGKAAQDAAKAKLRDLDARAKSDPDRHALGELIALYALPVARQWADRGIVTIPAAVIAAWLESHPNADWGGRYRHSKDVMHVELLAGRVLGRARSARIKGLADLVGQDPPPVPACRPVAWDGPQ